MAQSNVLQSAVYNLEYADNGEIQDAHGQIFDAASYSRMKYGSRRDTERYAHELVETFTDDASYIFESEEAPTFLVAFKAVQPACGYLTRYCLDRINRQRVEGGLEPAEMLHVYKNSVTNTDYSTASAEERAAELASIDFSLAGYRLDDRDVVILDDIRISGGAEKRILDTLAAEQQTPASVLLGYIAVFDTAQAATSPHVESHINTTAMSGANDLIPLIQSDAGFDLNIRTLKMILALSEQDLDNVLHAMTQEQLEVALRGALDTGPDFIQKYKSGYQQLVQYTGDLA